MMRKLLMSVAAAAILSTPAFGADTQSEKSKAKDPDKMVCKVDRSTGSSISERICKKRSQWDEDRDQARDALNDINHRQSRPVLPGGGGGMN